MNGIKKFAEVAVVGFFAAIVIFIVFVKAGQTGGKSGGEQTAEIFKGFGESAAKVASALEGNAA